MDKYLMAFILSMTHGLLPLKVSVLEDFIMFCLGLDPPCIERALNLREVPLHQLSKTKAQYQQRDTAQPTPVVVRSGNSAAPVM
ncbi:hypothetical protein NEUTE1DRAFT_42603 [Neurospora tetrasperma FGSC 2508]|uniref:Uncharacterized protein n=1 Tax=Neurospora tetrasperma (strain FGSC 2508 / ATCC MYA-4615 / P0657) TaxID=510951 RepID=F8MMQ5_NEUT8|nr:uncharacterized protein NEUTE1DRAFT_42603 [Neurospora tetrasperma FGSC 2508]EGO57929.1 hypothetical protein NEUTE1DRAFT_42603 [Neurospora tetrasperma FGSC 2508]EGZ71779.1 hypothetical protein NEUTE2DRAFT_65871 [Neurospora tetrasperma FGSC 2509]